MVLQHRRIAASRACTARGILECCGADLVASARRLRRSHYRGALHDTEAVCNASTVEASQTRCDSSYVLRE